jgi:hypothetical protein
VRAARARASVRHCRLKRARAGPVADRAGLDAGPRGEGTDGVEPIASLVGGPPRFRRGTKDALATPDSANSVQVPGAILARAEATAIELGCDLLIVLLLVEVEIADER